MKEKSFKVSGGLLYWTVSGTTDVDLLKTGLEAIGLGHLAPTRTPFPSVLKDALQYELGGPLRLIRPLNTKDGFYVCDEHRGDTKNKHTDVVSARVDEHGVVTFFESTLTRAAEQEILTIYEGYKDTLRPDQVTGMMVKALTSWDGIALRPGGTLYFLPAPALAQWRGLAAAVEAASEDNTTFLMTPPLDKDTLKAVQAGITSEAMDRAKKIEWAVETGNLGEKGLRTQVAEAKSLRDLIGEYEQLLNVTLTELRDVVDTAETAAASAVLLAAAAKLVPAAKQKKAA